MLQKQAQGNGRRWFKAFTKETETEAGNRIVYITVAAVNGQALKAVKVYDIMRPDSVVGSALEMRDSEGRLLYQAVSIKMPTGETWEAVINIASLGKEIANHE